MRIRYEDLLANPAAELDRIYQFMGVRLGPEEQMIHQEYFKAQELDYKTDEQEYYGVKRGKTFNPDKWKDYSYQVMCFSKQLLLFLKEFINLLSILLQFVRQIEEDCQNILNKFNYTIM